MKGDLINCNFHPQVISSFEKSCTKKNTTKPTPQKHLYHNNTLTTKTPSPQKHPHHNNTLTTKTPSPQKHPHHNNTLTTKTPSPHQHARFFDTKYERAEVASKVHANTTITSCVFQLRPLMEEHESLIYTCYWLARVVLVHVVPCVLLLLLNSLLLRAMRAASRRREQLFKQNRRTESRRLAESNVATLMLVIVVSVFLAVECPLAFFLLTLYYENVSSHEFMSAQNREFATFVINFFILLSYPLNFFIYCAMSRHFRFVWVDAGC